MSRVTGNPTACLHCGRPTSEPRKGACSACYQRARRGHDHDGACSVCGLADARVLRRHQLADGWTTLCANDAALAGRRPLSLHQLRAERYPDGDRRGADRRAGDRRDASVRRARVVVERLVGDDDRRERVGRRAVDAA